MREQGGFATLRHLYGTLDFSTWKTKTPEASVRRIVQDSKDIFRIRPGLWALEEARTQVLQLFHLDLGNQQSEDFFTHAYYQGLLAEIGKIKGFTTFVPSQDKNRLFLGKPLKDVSDMTTIPPFTYEKLLRKARTIDVVWLNGRDMPCDFYEVEHTTDIKNSLSKFFELQDFYSNFYIVADESREKEFKDKLGYSLYTPIRDRVRFLSYHRVITRYNKLVDANSAKW